MSSDERKATTTGELFQRHRIEAGLTVEDVARLMSMSQAHAYNIFQGKRMPSLVYAAQLARALNVPPEELLDAVLQDRPTRPQQEAHRDRLDRVQRPPFPSGDAPTRSRLGEIIHG